MPKDILVRMQIPIEVERIVPVPALIFDSWLPMKNKDAIVIECENMNVKIWFDPSCAENKTPEEYEKWRNVCAHHVNVDVVAKEVSNQLVGYIIECGNSSDLPDSPQKSEYRNLGESVYNVTVQHFNRLIKYAQFYKGQYWLVPIVQDHESMRNFFLKAKSKVRIGKEEQWHKWWPTNVNKMITIQVDDRLYILENDWEDVRDFVLSETRPALELELLSNAKRYAKQGEPRSAVIEVISALEVAVNKFLKSPNVEKLAHADRWDLSRLSRQTDKLGFRNIVCYLLPVLFDKEKMPTEFMKLCGEAIDERNNVIHSGKRTVSEEKVMEHLTVIEALCHLLIEATNT